MINPNTNAGFAFGVDLSSYNASRDHTLMPDFEQFSRHVPKVTFIALRATLGTVFSDDCFSTFLREGQRIGACLLPYHVFYPQYSVQRQMDHFLNALKGQDLDTLRLVLDMEKEESQPAANITMALSTAIQILTRECGRAPLVYSRALWVNEHLYVSDLPKVDWWLAYYYRAQPAPLYTEEHPCPPLLPRGVDRWRIHQTANRAPAITGASNYMDYDRWCGSTEDLLLYFGRIDNLNRRICPLDDRICDAHKTGSANVQAAAESAPQAGLRMSEAAQ